MDQSEIKIWAEKYIEAQDSSAEIDIDHPLWWPIGRFVDLEEEDPDSCWAAILEILSHNPSDNVIGILGAGPLEDLIHYHGENFIDRIESEASRNPAFRNLLKCVYESSTRAVWSRIERARNM